MWKIPRFWKRASDIPHRGPIDLTGRSPGDLKWALTYCNPDGEEVPPRREELRAVIYEQGPEYYDNAGGASLYGTARDAWGVVVYSAHNTPCLCWFLEEPVGFHFIFDPPKGPRQLTYDGSGPQPRIMHYVGGDPMYLPRGCFVSRDLAWEVVKEFIRTQQPSPVVKWITAHEFEALGIDHNRPN
jgi:Immunity protein Imm1